MNLRTRLQKTADADFVREMIKFAAQRLMELDVEALTGTAHGVRDPDRVTHRNGGRPRDWETCAVLPCRIPLTDDNLVGGGRKSRASPVPGS
jgi:transposase-like protein